MDGNLPITLLHWGAASLPIAVLLVLLVWQRWTTSAAAPLALATAVGVAVLFFRTSLDTLAIAAGKGIWDAIFVLYVIWPALTLYNVSNEAGAFGAMQRGLRRLMPDRLLVVLAFSWVLAPFIQSIAGFGTPLAVTTPLLLGLGMKPVYAVLFPMIGAAWANMFGSLGASWLATQTVVSLPDQTLMLRWTTLLLWIPILTSGLAIAWMYGKTWALRRAWPAIVIISLVHGGLQFWLVPLVPTVGNFLATIAGLLTLFALNRWNFYRQEDEDEPQGVFTDEGIQMFKEENLAHAMQQAEDFGREEMRRSMDHRSPRVGRSERPQLSLLLAFAPYAILAVLAITVLLIPPVNAFLKQVQVGLPFPAVSTGYGLERSAVASYAAFTPLTHPGTLLLISALAGYLLYRSRGQYPSHGSAWNILSRAGSDALPATTAITALLIISKVMDHSGEITVLALGIAQVAPPLLYVGMSGFIGILGSLTTSSNTASNVLFAPLQTTAAQAQNISVNLIVAAQSAGAAVGNALAPGDALLGATIAGIAGRLGAILAKALPWTLITGLLVSGLTVVLYLFVVG